MCTVTFDKRNNLPTNWFGYAATVIILLTSRSTDLKARLPPDA